MKVDGLKSTENGTTDEIASGNIDSNPECAQNTVKAHSNEDISAENETEPSEARSEVTGDVTQEPLSQSTTIIVAEPEAIEQALTTYNESIPVEIVKEALGADDSATCNGAVMIVEVTEDPAVEQKEEVTKQFIDVGIQVDLPKVDTRVHIDGNKITSDPTVTALLDELSSLK